MRAISWVLLLMLCPGMSVLCGKAQTSRSDAVGSGQSERLVDVGSRRLHIDCAGGNAESGPTVVPAPAGRGSKSMKSSRIRIPGQNLHGCALTTALGLGRSEPAATPRTVVAITQDLHTLLTNAKVTGPYVLIGHSLGGILARLYASYYPAEVVGMVLVDSAHEDEPDRGLALVPPETLKEMLKKAKPEDLIIRNPNESVDHCSLRGLLNAFNWRADIPLVVLTQGLPYRPEDYSHPLLAPKYYQLHLEMQRDLVRRSPRGRQIIAEKSGHFIHQDQPELVINAVRRVFDEIKADNSKPR